ncbi:MAG: 4-alpha-glucanotransferase [Anaerolineae bacterium]|nr:4-alpha-glucanotransferase [Anaerolineae bacterium]
MHYPRASGILLHPTSLPGPYGVGDLGDMAYRFVDYLDATGQTYWQILPLGPTSYGDSPYQTLSALAGNPLLISLARLAAKGWLTAADLSRVPNFPIFNVDYGPVIQYHDAMLNQAYARFKAAAPAQDEAAFEGWCAKNADWLEDFALFTAIKDSQNLRPWVEWPGPLALRDEAALATVRKELADKIDGQRFRQWLFAVQWGELREYAHQKGIRFIGDIPIFVAHDSSDVWANPHLFHLANDGRPTVIAGVPPDYFSETGQRWGNPLYRWEVMARDNYAWWAARFRATFNLVDVARIDHFRGFEAYWEIPASEETAINGQWIPGPGAPFFRAMQAQLGDLPIIAEDLGVITPAVVALRKEFGFPGMRVLQFAFGWDPYGDNVFLPHNYDRDSVVYAGTHDNNTTLGWWQSGEATHDARRLLETYIGHTVHEAHRDLMRLGMTSVGHTFVATLQDVFGFGADTRMNTPGVPSGNWRWRFEARWLDHHDSREWLATMTRISGRWPEAKQPKKDEDVADVALAQKKRAQQQQTQQSES